MARVPRCYLKVDEEAAGLFAHLRLGLDLRQLFHALCQLHSKLCVFVAHLWDFRAIFLSLLFNRNQSTIVTKLSSCASVTHFIKLFSLSGNLLARLLQLFVNNRLPSTLLAFSFSQLFFRLSLLRQQLRYLSRKLVHAVTWFLTRTQSRSLVQLLTTTILKGDVLKYACTWHCCFKSKISWSVSTLNASLSYFERLNSDSNWFISSLAFASSNFRSCSSVVRAVSMKNFKEMEEIYTLQMQIFQ